MIHSFQHLWGQAQDGEEGGDVLVCPLYGNGFFYTLRQVFQIILHSCISSLSHIFSYVSSIDKS